MPSSGMHAAWNIGYFYLKHTSLAAMLHWQQKCADNPKLWDQVPQPQPNPNLNDHPYANPNDHPNPNPNDHPHPPTLALTLALTLTSTLTLWDQNLFKDVLKIGGLQMPPRNSPEAATRLFRGYNRTLAIGILPVRSFCSGHTYFVQRMPQRAQIEPYSVRRVLGRAAAAHMHRAHAPHICTAHMHRTCTAHAGAHDLPVLWRCG